jgi:hypothetical protein
MSQNSHCWTTIRDFPLRQHTQTIPQARPHGYMELIPQGVKLLERENTT